MVLDRERHFREHGGGERLKAVIGKLVIVEGLLVGSPAQLSADHDILSIFDELAELTDQDAVPATVEQSAAEYRIDDPAGEAARTLLRTLATTWATDKWAGTTVRVLRDSNRPKHSYSRTKGTVTAVSGANQGTLRLVGVSHSYDKRVLVKVAQGKDEPSLHTYPIQRVTDNPDSIEITYVLGRKADEKGRGLVHPVRLRVLS